MCDDSVLKEICLETSRDGLGDGIRRERAGIERYSCLM